MNSISQVKLSRTGFGRALRWVNFASISLPSANDRFPLISATADQTPKVPFVIALGIVRLGRVESDQTDRPRCARYADGVAVDDGVASADWPGVRKKDRGREPRAKAQDRRGAGQTVDGLKLGVTRTCPRPTAMAVWGWRSAPARRAAPPPYETPRRRRNGRRFGATTGALVGRSSIAVLVGAGIDARRTALTCARPRAEEGVERPKRFCFVCGPSRC